MPVGTGWESIQLIGGGVVKVRLVPACGAVLFLTVIVNVAFCPGSRTAGLEVIVSNSLGTVAPSA